MTTTCETGRIAMDQPNLQTSPKARVIPWPRLSAEEPERQPLTSNVRRIFRAPRGFVILSADYKQVELRVMAHFANDEGLIRAFREGQADVFAVIAARHLKKNLDDVTGQERDKTKQVVARACPGVAGVGADWLASSAVTACHAWLASSGLGRRARWWRPRPRAMAGVRADMPPTMTTCLRASTEK